MENEEDNHDVDWALKTLKGLSPSNKTKTWHEVATILAKEVRSLRSTLTEEHYFKFQETVARDAEIQKESRAMCDAGISKKKVCYNSEQEALSAANKSGRRMRAYRCATCNKYHATKVF